MASLSTCKHPGKLFSSFSPLSIKLSSLQRVSVQFIYTHNHTCSLPSIPRPLTVISMAPPKPGGGKAKKVTGIIKLALEAGKATPAPPVGPALGSKGVNIMAFCKDYNARTADKAGYVIPVEITVYDDRSFTFILKTPPASVLLLKAADGWAKREKEKKNEIYWYGGLAASTISQSSSCISKVHKSRLRFNRTKVRAVESSERSREAVPHGEEEAYVKFAFVSSVLLPDGTPDVQLRKACGGQKLRDIMLDANVELYGPYARPLLNCGGGGTCATCLVEVVEGKELLNPRTDKENENLKRMTIQQLPEWKAHEWNYRGLSPNEEEEAASISSSSA
ncbi:uncharacterized protein LOC129890251 isoform X2 [Solanum dulcamara]|uniref:uncharacterized protein LOC129890251 isoform X2 n=1 Tax=Solanum dulcamara TaxID=45834 RepID=UPI002486C8C3|nr:uncharacterized protein LOC129890251 isoform X2 [Solanum dulcamara]